MGDNRPSIKRASHGAPRHFRERAGRAADVMVYVVESVFLNMVFVTGVYPAQALSPGLASDMTFKTLLDLMRIGVTAAALGLLGLMLGPFQGLERELGMGDYQAHALAFYGVTLLVFLVAPRSRRSDLVLILFGVGLLIELAQGVVGRAMSLTDVLANTLGIAAAYAPGLAEQVRRQLRHHPDRSITTMDRLDRRRRAPSSATASSAAAGLARPALERALGQGDGRYSGGHDAHVHSHRPPTGVQHVTRDATAV